MCVATRDIMDGMFEIYLEGSLILDDIPQTDEPVYILGKKYDATEDITQIRQDITSRIWLTYRKNFVPIGGDEGPTSDKGWGCMLRCGQMVLAQAIINSHLGRDWMWEPETKDAIYLKIIRKFEDNRQAPFSIHQIALTGLSEGKQVGQWFGPNTVSQVLKKLVKYDDWCSIAIHVALDNTVIISDIKNLCETRDETNSIKNKWKPLLLIVPLRLGLQEMNPIYISGLKKCFQFKQSLGVIGGKPNLALYFIGCVGDEVIYLDPHTTQRAGSVGNKETEDEIGLDLTYHCKFASRVNISQIDPSVAVCFFCKSENEFNELCQTIQDNLVKPEIQPLFEICYDRPKQWVPSAVEEGMEARASHLHQYDSDEFEIL